MLFNEPKLLKCCELDEENARGARFSALQRAEIAEIEHSRCFLPFSTCFSALQRAEIAEIRRLDAALFRFAARFSALQRAEIAEISATPAAGGAGCAFQCSSTSRNC